MAMASNSLLSNLFSVRAAKINVANNTMNNINDFLILVWLMNKLNLIVKINFGPIVFHPAMYNWYKNLYKWKNGTNQYNTGSHSLKMQLIPFLRDFKPIIT